MKPHKERKHSKFSASGASRWMNCPGSVELSEGLPDKESVWSKEGTKAHEILEITLKNLIKVGPDYLPPIENFKGVTELAHHALNTAFFIVKIGHKNKGEFLVETRIHLDFIHPEMFGTFDAAVLDHFGTLHVFDYKYGAGVAVSPIENLQMIFYALGLAHQYDYNFKKVRMWIVQPRVKGYDGPTFWEISIIELKSYEAIFKDAVKKVLNHPDEYLEGSWCHWCKCKQICPLKKEAKVARAKEVFAPIN